MAKKDLTYTYNARVIRVIDGDTLDADIDLGFDIHVHKRLRLAGINAPEVSTPEGRASRDYLKSFLLPGSDIQILTERGPDLYNRWVATVTFSNTNVNKTLVSKGMAVVSIYK